MSRAVRKAGIPRALARGVMSPMMTGQGMLAMRERAGLAHRWRASAATPRALPAAGASSRAAARRRAGRLCTLSVKMRAFSHPANRNLWRLGRTSDSCRCMKCTVYMMPTENTSEPSRVAFAARDMAMPFEVVPRSLRRTSEWVLVANTHSRDEREARRADADAEWTSRSSAEAPPGCPPSATIHASIYHAHIPDTPRLGATGLCNRTVGTILLVIASLAILHGTLRWGLA